VTFGTGNLPGQGSVQRGEPALIRASATHREGNKPFTRITTWKVIALNEANSEDP
jgi:hypothetical protein